MLILNLCLHVRVFVAPRPLLCLVLCWWQGRIRPHSPPLVLRAGATSSALLSCSHFAAWCRSSRRAAVPQRVIIHKSWLQWGLLLRLSFLLSFPSIFLTLRHNFKTSLLGSLRSQPGLLLSASAAAVPPVPLSCCYSGTKQPSFGAFQGMIQSLNPTRRHCWR